MPPSPTVRPRKWMDSARLNALGWNAQFCLQQGLSLAHQDFKSKNGL